ncbi:MAG TPA: ISL3 family transposase [Candidatus Limnocylindrales bacterium]|nr:ISL3 family transposase [Candidatus Limnocylindrales bacterium]
MRGIRVWARLLGLARAVVEDVFLDEDAVVVCARPRARERGRCPRCRRRCPGYDDGDGRRRWRALDLGTTKAFVEARAPRVECKRHGAIVAAVPWARHDSSFTRAFEDQAAWLAVNTSATAVAQLMRSTWRAIGGICARVADEARAQRDLLAGLRRIGIDEISVRKGQTYITVVVDHDSGRLVWASPGRDGATVRKFLDLLGKERCEQIELVSCDMASQITGPIAERCPNASVCLDPFHVVKLATDALDEIRRAVWNQARKDNNKQLARDLKGARFALWKNAENLTARQQRKLAHIQQTNKPLYRGYLLAQQLRQIYRVPAEQATKLLDAWLKWAWRCRLQPFVALARTIRDQRPGIQAAIENGLSNARTEQVNTQIRLITRRGFGYHSQQAVIALAMLSLGGLCPPLPGR